MNENLIDFINKHYDLSGGEIDKVAKVTEGGYQCENHILYNKDNKYFIKKYRYKDPKVIQEIHDAKHVFKSNGIPVVFPITTKTGDTFFSYENSIYAIFPFVEAINKYEIKDLSDRSISSIASLLAKMHLIGKNYAHKVSSSCTVRWDIEETLKSIQSLKDIISRLPNKTDFDDLALKGIKQKEELISKNLYVYDDFNLEEDHLVHGDYYYGNLFFNKEDEVTYVYDFERAKNSSRGFELIRAIDMMALSNESIESGNFDKSVLFFSSYNKIYPMPKGLFTLALRVYFLSRIYSFWGETEYYLKNNTKVSKFLDSYSPAKHISFYKDRSEEFINLLYEKL